MFIDYQPKKTDTTSTSISDDKVEHLSDAENSKSWYLKLIIAKDSKKTVYTAFFSITFYTPWLGLNGGVY